MSNQHEDGIMLILMASSNDFSISLSVISIDDEIIKLYKKSVTFIM